MFKKIKEWFNREPVSFDEEEGTTFVIPCPPEHGMNCRCTWY